MAKSGKIAAKIKKKDRKNIPEGIVFIYSTFNNTVITIADKQGNTLSWSSAGVLGFKGSRKSTPFAAQNALNDAVFGVAYTNVAYHVTDSIAVSPDKIGFNYLILSDDLGNYGLASATVTSIRRSPGCWARRLRAARRESDWGRFYMCWRSARALSPY